MTTLPTSDTETITLLLAAAEDLKIAARNYRAKKRKLEDLLRLVDAREAD
jgi:hypothetical protein